VRVGVLTGGGDCPGLNAVIRAVARRSLDRGHEVIGVRAGWRGLIEDHLEPLGPREISGILPRGGTIIGTSRTNPYKVEDGVNRVLANFSERLTRSSRSAAKTPRVAPHASTRRRPYAVGVPKTIDNDLSGTDYTFGFDTAVAICTEAIDRLHTTAEPHNRVMVVEVAGSPDRLDRGHERDRGRCGRDPDPRVPVDRRGDLRGDREAPPPRQGLLHRRRQRGVQTHLRVR
jgi:6-phosphofructokinase 1